MVALLIKLVVGLTLITVRSSVTFRTTASESVDGINAYAIVTVHIDAFVDICILREHEMRT